MDLWSVHNIVIDTISGYAYAVGSNGGGESCGGGLYMIDIRTPDSPKFAGCFADPTTGRAGTGYIHDAQCTVYHGPDKRYTGKQICFNAAETALSIADVTDKKNPVALSRQAYPNVGYAHQGWLTADQKYFYMDDELDELQGLVDGTRTLIWDVSKLDDPVLAGQYISKDKSSDHNLYIVGNTMYQSNYESGLRVVDISDRENPKQVGFFDTVPIGTDAPGFGGSWSNYPFFQSGNVLMTSGAEGLFIVRKHNSQPVP
jgi:choice-of-anchor B domain-containing protein